MHLPRLLCPIIDRVGKAAHLMINLLAIYGPCRLFDFELEIGFFVRLGNQLGSQNSYRTSCRPYISNGARQRLICGYPETRICSTGTFSVQKFRNKHLSDECSFALAPFSIPNMSQNVEVLPYLKHDVAYNFDIQLAVAIQGE